MTLTNRIDKIHALQQHLSTSSVVTYARMSLGRLEAIHVFHKRRNLGLHFSAQLFADACRPGIRMYRIYVNACRKRVSGIVEPCLPGCLRITLDRDLCRFLQRNCIDVGYDTSWALYRHGMLTWDRRVVSEFGVSSSI